MEKNQNNWKIRKLCTRCGNIYFGRRNSSTCDSPKCNLVVAVSILRKAIIKIHANKHLSKEKKEQIIMKVIKKVV